MTNFKEVAISELFDLRNGDAKYIRSYIDSHSGPYPIYSAAVSKPFGFVNSYDYEGAHLTWVMNGYGGRVLEVSGRFSANRDRGVLVPHPDVRTPDLTYIRQELEPILRELAVGRRVDGRLNEYTKIYPPIARTATVRLPVTVTGDVDYALMDEIGARLRRVDAANAALSGVLDDLDRANLTFICPEPYVVVPLSDASKFSLMIGSRLLLKDQLSAGIPAYSANVHRPFGYVASSKLTDFSRPSLIWGIDGIFDWSLIDAGEKFEVTDHCGRLQVTDDNLDPKYLLLALRASRVQYGFDRVYRASLGNVRSDVGVPVPLADDGSFSLERQREIADRLSHLYELKSASVEATRYVASAKLSATLTGL